MKRTVERSRVCSPGSSVASRATRSIESELRELENTLLRDKVELQAKQLESQTKQIETLQQELAFHRQMGERFMTWMDHSIRKPSSDSSPPAPVFGQVANNALHTTTSLSLTKTAVSSNASGETETTNLDPKKIEKTPFKTSGKGKTGKYPDRTSTDKQSAAVVLQPSSASGKTIADNTKDNSAMRGTTKENATSTQKEAADKLKQKAIVVLARADASKPAGLTLETPSAESQRTTEKQPTPKPVDKSVEAAVNANTAVLNLKAVIITDDVDLEPTSGASVSAVAPPKSSLTPSEKSAEMEDIQTQKTHTERTIAIKNQTVEVSFAASGRTDDRGREWHRRDERQQDQSSRRSPSRHGRNTQQNSSPTRRERTPPRHRSLRR